MTGVRWVVRGFDTKTEREKEVIDLPSMTEAELRRTFNLPDDEDLFGAFPVVDVEVIARVEALTDRTLDRGACDYFFEGEAI